MRSDKKYNPTYDELKMHPKVKFGVPITIVIGVFFYSMSIAEGKESSVFLLILMLLASIFIVTLIFDAKTHIKLEKLKIDRGLSFYIHKERLHEFEEMLNDIEHQVRKDFDIKEVNRKIINEGLYFKYNVFSDEVDYYVQLIEKMSQDARYKDFLPH